jgi:hypothetical protein
MERFRRLIPRALAGAWTAHEAATVAVLVFATLNFTPTLFQTVSVSDEAPWTKVLKDVPVLALTLLLFMILLRDPRARAAARERASELKVPIALLGALFILMLLSFVLVAAPTLGTFVTARYYIGYPLLALLVALTPGPPRLAERLAAVLLILAGLEVVLAIADFAGLFGSTYYSNHVRLGPYLVTRAIGTLGNPNNLGVFLGLALILVVSGLPRGISGRWSLPVIGALVLGAALTFSKTIIIGIVGILAWSVLRRSHGVIGRLRAGAVIVAGLTVLVLAGTSRRGAGLSLEGIAGSRQDTITDAWRNWTSDGYHFIFGEGWASLSDVLDGRLSETVTDNMFLTLGLETGLIGLLLFTALCTWLLVALFRLHRESRLAQASFTFAVFFCCYAPIAINFRLFPGALLFWLLGGLALRERLWLTAADNKKPPES